MKGNNAFTITSSTYSMALEIEFFVNICDCALYEEEKRVRLHNYKKGYKSFPSVNIFSELRSLHRMCRYT